MEDGPHEDFRQYQGAAGQVQHDKPQEAFGHNHRCSFFAVTALHNNRLHENLLMLHPYMGDVTFVDLKVLVMKYYWGYVKHSQTPQSPVDML